MSSLNEFNRCGRFPLYPLLELDAWALARLGEPVSNTTEADARQSPAENA